MHQTSARLIASVILCAIGFLALTAVRGLSVESVELAAFGGILLFLSLTDIAERRIPNGCIAAALAVRFAYMAVALACNWMTVADVGYYVLSACVIAAMLLVMTAVADKLFGHGSLGGGDLKLYAVVGLFFGWEQGLAVILISCALGVIASIVQALGDRGAPDAERRFLGRTLPFGPFIAFACVAVIVFNNMIGF